MYYNGRRREYPVRSRENGAKKDEKKLSKKLKIKTEKLLLKKENIQTQSRLLKTGRRSNVRGAFYILEKEKVHNKKIILVDDIFTTGATIRECCKILKEAGAQDILVLVLAKD